MINNPKISVITPVFNVQDDIETCILSVSNQSYKNIEHVIIDGLSTDKTLSIVKKYAEKYPHIRLISEKDNGIYDAMNKGLKISSGEWVYFLGSDDVFLNNQVLDDIFKKGNIGLLDIIYGDVLWGNSERVYDGSFTLAKLVEQNICHQAIFFKKDVFNKLGNFDVKYKALADWAFNLKWFSDTKIKRKYIPLIISRYHVGGFSSLYHDKIFFENMPIILDKNFPAEHADAYKKILSLKQEISNLNQNIQKKDSEMQDLNIELRDLQDQNNRLQLKLDQKENEIAFITSSKFWKIRNAYVRLKGLDPWYLFRMVRRSVLVIPRDGLGLFFYYVRKYFQFGRQFFKDKVTIGSKRIILREKIRNLYKKFQIKQSLERFYLDEKEVQSLRNIEKNKIRYFRPRVSIIVPMHNKSQITIECFKSIVKNTVGVSYELILLDNGSEIGESERVRAFIDGDCAIKSIVKFIRLESNRGFGEGNNIAVEHAKGKYLLFLNNDVEVSYNWLFPLVYTLENAPYAGCVGAKLIYPDGKLQEAGAFINKDGTSNQRGKFDDPGKPEYDDLMIVDYCSASTLLVAKDLFKKSLGFDLCYDPAYYEDSDLCLKIRELGYFTYYCPQSSIIHHENFTSRGMNLNNIIEVNRDKFLQRWKDKIGPEFVGNVPSFQTEYKEKIKRKADEKNKKRLGLLTWYELVPGGGEKYLLSFGEVLKENYNIQLIAPYEASQIRLANIIKELSIDIDKAELKTISQATQQRYDLFVSLGNEVMPFVKGKGRVNLYACQFPFPTEGKNLDERKTFLETYDRVIVYSEFSKEHYLRAVKETGQAMPQVSVLYPPVSLVSGNIENKKKIILHVGRFFKNGHNKKQFELVRAFKELMEKYNIQGWELHLAGSIQPGLENRDYFLKVKKEAADTPVVIHPNIPREKLEQLYREASIYWHATGYGRDPDLEPEKQEHFGITTVEAMSAKCVPIVIATAGQKEIIEDGKTGFIWNNMEDLQKITNKVIQEIGSDETNVLKENAFQRARNFSVEAFSDNLNKILESIRKK